MKHPTRLLMLCVLGTATLSQACGGEDDPTVTDSYSQMEQARSDGALLQCGCLLEKGEYVSEAECLAERDAKPSDEWLACAEEVVNTGGFSDALLCYAEKFDAAETCIEEATCESGTYSLSVAACFSAAESDATNTCALLGSALDAIAAACDASDPSGGGVAAGSLPLGALCQDDVDCISGECFESEYGAPFCTRSCDEPQVDCPAGDDAGIGEALCVSFADDQLPFPELVDDFNGEMDTFCVPRCQDVKDCRAGNESWETCTSPKYKGNVIYPGLGTGGNICQSPSHHGKDPVDPSSCNYEKTIGNFGGEASLCGFYCDFIEACLFVETGAYPEGCCEWGCFSRMVPEGDQVDDAWHDEVKCFVEDHNAWPAVGVDNACNHPPKACGGTPEDPTHPAAVPL
jgi:hypothetical protein